MISNDSIIRCLLTQRSQAAQKIFLSSAEVQKRGSKLRIPNNANIRCDHGNIVHLSLMISEVPSFVIASHIAGSVVSFTFAGWKPRKNLKPIPRDVCFSNWWPGKLLTALLHLTSQTCETCKATAYGKTMVANHWDMLKITIERITRNSWRIAGLDQVKAARWQHW